MHLHLQDRPKVAQLKILHFITIVTHALKRYTYSTVDKARILAAAYRYWLLSRIKHTCELPKLIRRLTFLSDHGILLIDSSSTDTA